MFSRNHLSQDEKVVYDKAMDEACFDNGAPVATSRIADRLRPVLTELADQGRFEWAQWLLDDAADRGLKSFGKAWQNSKAIHETSDGEAVVATRSDIVRVRSLNRETGRTEYQATFWRDMTVADLHEEVRACNARLKSDRDRMRDLLRCIDLCEQLDVTDLNAALSIGGYSDISEFLTSKAA